MPYTFDSALDDNLVHVIERDDKFGGEVTLRIVSAIRGNLP